ncbi:hypothetical protein ID866_7952 [Astraeus odoratus]|nr:hypothetical protein ID866_7952 [Astraeus odoratus]
MSSPSQVGSGSPKPADSTARDAAEDDLPQYSNACGSSPPRWQPRFEDLTSESLGRLSHVDRRPLDPPPECFSTPSPLRVRSNDFPPFRIPSISDKLIDGFRVLYPRDPLEKHGITQDDWVRFLEDLVIAARLATQGLSAVGSRVPVKPLPARCLFITWTPGAAYDIAFQRSRLGEVKALITVWNESAFIRRKVRVSIQVREEQGRKSGYDLIVESL